MKNSLPRSITIDGPVAAGKSTVGKAIADKFNYLLVDTGFFYRTVTLICLENNIDLRNDSQTGKIAAEISIELIPQKNKTNIIANGKDVSNLLRTPLVDKNVQYIAANPSVRNALTPQMRNIAKKHNVVMIGRDIGTVVLPKADLKLWLDASVEERANRRKLEQNNKGNIISYEEILKDIKLRDKVDSERKSAPMKIPAGAIIIDSNNLNIPQTIDKTIDIIKNWSKSQKL